MGRHARLPGVSLGITDTQIAFMTSNAWDAAGAASGGLRVGWINRLAQPQERLPHGPEHTLDSLTDLPKLLT